MEILPKMVSPDSIVNGLYTLPVKTQFCHHLTNSYAAHKALDSAYDSLNDLKDSIIEKLIGYTGVKFTSISIPSISNFSESMCMSVALEIISFGETIEEYGVKQDYSDIENLGQEYSGVGAQLKYLLGLK